MIIIAIVIIGFLIIVIVGVYWQNRAPLEPEITYGEFPFRFEYEIDGERFVIEDTIIAEFERSVRGDMTTQAARRWQTTLMNNEGDNDPLGGSGFLLREKEDITIIFNPGFATYFMGDIDAGIRGRSENNNDVRSGPNITVRNPNFTPILTTIRVEDAHELLAEHGIILISWEYTPPVENSFGD